MLKLVNIIVDFLRMTVRVYTGCALTLSAWVVSSLDVDVSHFSGCGLSVGNIQHMWTCEVMQANTDMREVPLREQCEACSCSMDLSQKASIIRIGLTKCKCYEPLTTKWSFTTSNLPD